YDLIGEVCGKPVREKAPDHRQRLSVLMQIARVLRDVQVVNQPLPIVCQLTVKAVGGLPTHVVGDGDSPARSVGCVARVYQNLGWMVLDANDEPLHEDSVN